MIIYLKYIYLLGLGLGLSLNKRLCLLNNKPKELF